MKHLLVTNDFPPKIGGIQSYLWELWRRLPPDSFAVLTTPHAGDAEFDRAEPYRVERVRSPVLLPEPLLRGRIEHLASEVGAELVVLDPALPVGALGPSLSLPFDVVVHGAEITVPGRLPGSRHLLGAVLRRARHVIAAGGYPLAESEHAAGRSLTATVVPPGVDVDRFAPLDPEQRRAARARYGVADDDLLVVSYSRLVPRKGMDVLIRAAGRLAPRFPSLRVLVGGTGRDTERLTRLVADTRAPVELAGFVPDDELPTFVGAADVAAMLCRDRWAGLEQEGFGIVFLEAAAAGVPQLAGSSGGAAEAVSHGETGLVVDRPADVDAVTEALETLLADPDRRAGMAMRSRVRAVEEFSYDVLVDRLARVLDVDAG